MITTNQPKSITLPEFEELAKVFEASHGWHWNESYGVAIESFKAFIFKEELEKSQRRKDYEKLKEEYFKLKYEFEPEDIENESAAKICAFKAGDRVRITRYNEECGLGWYKSTIGETHKVLDITQQGNYELENNYIYQEQELELVKSE